MKFAIEICFDDATANELTNVWNLLREKGLADPQTAKRPYMPHISLAVTPNLDTEKFSGTTQEIAQKHRSICYLPIWGYFVPKKKYSLLLPKYAIH
jgi:hypothetical protein